MKEMPQMPDDVQRLFALATNIVATDSAEYFKDRVHGMMRYKQITSPIEQRLFIAMYTVAEVWNLFHFGLMICPQHIIGTYKVDYLLCCTDAESGRTKRAVVECDSWQYHERSPERSTAEKKRDRFFQFQGLMTLHYSGQEINADPFRVAAEALAHVWHHTWRCPEKFYRGGVSRDQFFYSTIKDLASKNDVVAKAEAMLRNIQ